MTLTALSTQIRGTLYPRGAPEASASLLLTPPLASLSRPREREIELDLARLWSGLVSGQYYLEGCRFSPSECELSIRERPERARPNALTDRVRLILERVLLGESQYALSLDLGIAPSSVTIACERGLSSMSFARLASRSPAVLVMSAHAAHGFRLPKVRLHEAAERGGPIRATLVRPDLVLPEGLTASERAVVHHVVEGHTKSMIAEARGTAKRTIANQLGSVFRKLGISGRGELLACLVRHHAANTREAAIAERHRDPGRGPGGDGAPSQLCDRLG
jgi:DNA-binding CsgD family transcriptional regulator